MACHLIAFRKHTLCKCILEQVSYSQLSHWIVYPVFSTCQLEVKEGKAKSIPTAKYVTVYTYLPFTGNLCTVRGFLSI